MRDGRRNIKIAAAAVLLALGGISVMSIKKSSENGYFGGAVEFSFGGKSAKLQNTIEIPMEKAKSLGLKYKNKNVKIYPAQDGNIVIKEYLYSDNPQALAQVDYGENGEVTVTGGDIKTFMVFGFGFGEGERIEVYLPEKGMKALDVETGSGNITSEAGNLELEESLLVIAGSGNVKWSGGKAKDFSFRAGSGNVRVEEIKGNVTVKTGSGNIAGKKVEGVLNVEAGSGNIALEEFSGEGRAQAGSGNIKVEEGEITGDLDLQTNSGNIRVALAGEAHFHFDISTGSGIITTDFDQQLSFNKRKNSAEGDVGEAPLWQFKAKTGSGNVHIVRS